MTTARGPRALPLRAAPPGTGRLPGFDGLRAIAALFVFVLHVEYFAPAANEGVHRFVSQLRSGVWIFFVLSGFLLYRPFVAAHAGDASRPSTRTYLLRRALRIFPAYWVALLVLTYVVSRTLVRHGDFGDLLVQLGLVQIYDVADTFGGLPHTWSLAVEVTFYAFLPVYAFAVARLVRVTGALRAEVAGLVAMCAFGLAWMVLTQGEGVKHQWLPNFLCAFAGGMALAVVVVHAPRVPRLQRAVDVVAGAPLLCWALAALALVLRSFVDIDIARENWLVSQVFYIPFGVLAVLPAVFGGERSDIVRDFLRSRVLAFLGTISYGIFLWHYVIIQIVRDDWFGWGPDDARAIVVAIVALAVTVAIATASWYVVERPALRLGQRPRR